MSNKNIDEMWETLRDMSLRDGFDISNQSLAFYSGAYAAVSLLSNAPEPSNIAKDIVAAWEENLQHFKMRSF